MLECRLPDDYFCRDAVGCVRGVVGVVGMAGVARDVWLGDWGVAGRGDDARRRNIMWDIADDDIFG